MIIMIMEWMIWNNGRDDRLLRPLNTLDGSDVIELEERERNEFNNE